MYFNDFSRGWPSLFYFTFSELHDAHLGGAPHSGAWVTDRQPALRTSTSTATVLLLRHQSKLFFFFLFYKALMIWCPSERKKIMFLVLVMGKNMWIIIHRHHIDDFLLSLVIQQTDIRKSLWQWNHGNVYTVTVWPNYIFQIPENILILFYIKNSIFAQRSLIDTCREK